MDDLLKAQLFAAVRAALYVAGTVAVSLGHHVPDEQVMTEVAGALTVVIAFVWSIWDKHQSHGATVAAEPSAAIKGENNA